MKRTQIFALLIACPLIWAQVQHDVTPPAEPIGLGTAVALSTADAALDSAAASARATLGADRVTARGAILIDADSGKTLFQKNADVQMAPASTTKLMTLLVAVERGNLSQVVTVPDSAAKAPVDSTRVPVYPGEQMPLRDLLYGLMIKSGNDAANAIGTIVSGSVDAFVSDMNARARQMGLKNTRFANAHGYPAAGHVTTARDLATITRVALGNSGFKKILYDRSHTMAATSLRGEKKLQNAYSILDPGSEMYYKYAKGGKTGYAAAAGQCFVCVAEKDGRTLISVVLNAGGTKTPKWADTRTMFEYGFDLLGI